MRNKKDILDILKEDLSGYEVKVEEKEWVKIKSAYDSKMFYRWNYRKINVFYLGAIIISFMGTFWLASDYLYTKNKVLEAYENRISALEKKIKLLNDEQKNISIEPVEQNSSEKAVKEEKKDNVLSPEQHDPSSSKKPTSPLESQLMKEKKTTPHNVVDTIEQKNLFSPKEVTIIDTNLSKTQNEVLKKLEETQQQPVIIVVQDTIIEYDSVKVSRHQLKKKHKRDF